MTARALVGKWFLGDETYQHRGQVIAEVTSGSYLVRIDRVSDGEWIARAGEPLYKRLVNFEDMMTWRFYDTREKLLVDYRRAVSHLWLNHNAQQAETEAVP